MAGKNAHQKVPDKIYSALQSKEKTNLTIQKTIYYLNKLKGKKYLRARRIESISEGTGQTVEDIYGTIINGPHLVINLKLREKTK